MKGLRMQPPLVIWAFGFSPLAKNKSASLRRHPARGQLFGTWRRVTSCTQAGMPVLRVFNVQIKRILNHSIRRKD